MSIVVPVLGPFQTRTLPTRGAAMNRHGRRNDDASMNTESRINLYAVLQPAVEKEPGLPPSVVLTIRLERNAHAWLIATASRLGKPKTFLARQLLEAAIEQARMESNVTHRSPASGGSEVEG